jgi:hypothetical protein
VGEHVFRPVVLGQVDWLGGPHHDHARVGFRIAPQVLAHIRQYHSQTGNKEVCILLKDWQLLGPALQLELSTTVSATLARVLAGTIDVGTAVQDTLRDRNQLARNWMT